MEIAIAVVIIGLVFYFVSRRFKGFVRNSLYIDKPDFNALALCRAGDKVQIVKKADKRLTEVICKDTLIGYIPDDYNNVILRQIFEKELVEGTIVAINKNGCKIQVDIKGEPRDMVGG